jgi:hypothetical protein
MRDHVESGAAEYNVAQLQSFAEIVGAEAISGPLNETGKSPGRPLREYLELAKGTDIYDMPVPSSDQHRLRSVARLTGDERLQGIASTGIVPISLSHLRDRDAETLVRVGYRITYSPEEIQQLGLDDPDRRT